MHNAQCIMHNMVVIVHLLPPLVRASSLSAASGRYSEGAECTAVGVQRSRAAGKAHTGHRKRKVVFAEQKSVG